MRKLPLIIIAIIGLYIFLLIKNVYPIYSLHTYNTKLLTSPMEVIQMSACDADDDGQIVSIYKFLLGEDQLTELIKNIGDKTNDNCTFGFIAEYALQEDLCEFLPLLEARSEYLDHIPSDTIWREKISENYYRKSYSKGPIEGIESASNQYLRRAIKELRNTCK